MHFSLYLRGREELLVTVHANTVSNTGLVSILQASARVAYPHAAPRRRGAREPLPAAAAAAALTTITITVTVTIAIPITIRIANTIGARFCRSRGAAASVSSPIMATTALYPSFEMCPFATACYRDTGQSVPPPCTQPRFSWRPSVAAHFF